MVFVWELASKRGSIIAVQSSRVRALDLISSVGMIEIMAQCGKFFDSDRENVGMMKVLFCFGQCYENDCLLSNFFANH